MQALTNEQYSAIIRAMRKGSCSLRADPNCAVGLMAAAAPGLRVSEIPQLSGIAKDSGRYRLIITKEKTRKRR